MMTTMMFLSSSSVTVQMTKRGDGKLAILFRLVKTPTPIAPPPALGSLVGGRHFCVVQTKAAGQSFTRFVKHSGQSPEHKFRASGSFPLIGRADFYT